MQGWMGEGYDDVASNVGKGCFGRMKQAMKKHIGNAKAHMFNEASRVLLDKLTLLQVYTLYLWFLHSLKGSFVIFNHEKVSLTSKHSTLCLKKLEMGRNTNIT